MVSIAVIEWPMSGSIVKVRVTDKGEKEPCGLAAALVMTRMNILSYNYVWKTVSSGEGQQRSSDAPLPSGTACVVCVVSKVWCGEGDRATSNDALYTMVALVDVTAVRIDVRALVSH